MELPEAAAVLVYRHMNRIASRLLTWYRQNGRDLPWRKNLGPYAVWVSEIMLQQTRVETVIPYFKKWMRIFPTVNDLADASEQDVLNAWEGLGYYSRARNLHKAARILVTEHNGRLPRDLKALRALPGIGRYSVGAIASIAFGMDEPTLDGNLRRVFARLFDVEEYADSPGGEKILWGLASEHLPEGYAGDYNQALMDLGALVCLPRNPRCLLCPLLDDCQSQRNGTQELRPVLKPKKVTPRFIHAAGVVIEDGSILLAQRPREGLLGGMWEFPNGRVVRKPDEELEAVLENEYNLKVQRGEALGVVKHAYTHYKVTEYVFRCRLVSMSANENMHWVNLKELENYPMGKIDRRIAGMLNG